MNYKTVMFILTTFPITTLFSFLYMEVNHLDFKMTEALLKSQECLIIFNYTYDMS